MIDFDTSRGSRGQVKRYTFLYHEIMKTTLNIDDRLLAEAKAAAALKRLSLTRLVEEGLNLRLRQRGTQARRTPVELPVYHGKGGLAPGIDPASNRSLFEAAGDE